MLELVLTTKRFEAITERLDNAWMFNTYDPLLRNIVAWRTAIGWWRSRHVTFSARVSSMLLSHHCIALVRYHCLVDEVEGRYEDTS